ncbi:MAG: hypothetical protein O3A00_27465 [Planctomycetota bacterium]|nr:hypothetical protein [Planctomycetota bacterium]
MVHRTTNAVLELPAAPPLNRAEESRREISNREHGNPSPSRFAVASRSGLRREWKVIAFVAVVLLSAEFGIRGLESRVSKDFVGIRSFPEIAATFSEPQHANDHRILFLGNSLTRDGIDVEFVTQELARSPGRSGHSGAFVRKATADGSGIVEWFYAFRNQFVKTGHAPDMVVLGFEGPRGGHVGDSRKFDPSTLGYLFSELDDLPDVMQHEVAGFGERTDFLLGLVSAAYANRQRVQYRVLDTIIPDYRESSDRINEAVVDPQPRVPTNPVNTFTRLSRFVELAHVHNVQVVLVAIPVPDEYDIAPGLIEFCAARNIRLIDARRVPGIDNSMFPDGLHMNPVAAGRFSRYVARRLPN